jgi:putative spermidine/putrescine transport system permease protein
VALAWTVVVLVFLYAPMALVVLNAFNSSRTFAFPPTGFTVEWWRDALNSAGMWKALANSAVVGLAATMIALVLGTMAAFAVQRYDFFGRYIVSFLVVLPITLPGIVTGIALNATFTSALGMTLGLATVIIGHATFCIVIVFNNSQARLRRLGSNLEDASADLGASPWQTFRYVSFPMMRGALVAGAILAFALSFDEIVVTTFTAGPTVQTLPIWIFGNLFGRTRRPSSTWSPPRSRWSRSFRCGWLSGSAAIRLRRGYSPHYPLLHDLVEPIHDNLVAEMAALLDDPAQLAIFLWRRNIAETEPCRHALHHRIDDFGRQLVDGPTCRFGDVQNGAHNHQLLGDSRHDLAHRLIGQHHLPLDQFGQTEFEQPLGFVAVRIDVQGYGVVLW